MHISLPFRNTNQPCGLPFKKLKGTDSSKGVPLPVVLREDGNSVYPSLSDLECVLEVHVLYGEHDLIARIGAQDSSELATILLSTFRTIKGIRDTETLITVDY